LQGEREQGVPGSDADELSALDEASHPFARIIAIKVAGLLAPHDQLLRTSG